MFMFELIIMIAFNYYITVFCAVFHSNQINVLVTTLFSIIISILCSFFIFGFLSFVQMLAIRYNYSFIFYCVTYIIKIL